MSPDVAGDQFVVIRVEGMHCHKCEASLQKALGRVSGVREVEVDFNSKLASILIDKSLPSVDELLQAVADCGYQVAGFTQGAENHSENSTSSSRTSA